MFDELLAEVRRQHIKEMRMVAEIIEDSRQRGLVREEFARRLKDRIEKEIADATANPGEAEVTCAPK